ncbi:MULTISPECIES: 4Fe-4S binding protein [unclassified Undibacterium]|uniref:4Fe-4S binding protein n=1 Tax=unclassified Undibacterium TaxID=2630295 RepID=UPI002AC8B9B2|nr:MULTISPECIES: 4Fe-4S binding protein [unclassified Undibacterium]MEB0141028.1 4Fe-4S binding protein [Undibacterium sp. CCC2.1]MEB0174016.1 4Fe-4S binding protein [Undibacterium sp. CCC1.1]MEB0177972.1 4Fe-4S binding protein [Undibacterium sp. CCC3.4]MEB0217204.1 4Fe-4S binding protein [Undibacterium sp. 5I2]WPX42180.1 4Fe-4S binding protein [Undibacterium sp. CCC3.4]
MNPQIKICSCNNTLPLNAAAAAKLAAATGASRIDVSERLCRRDVGSFLTVLQGVDEVIVACTQERSLFSELAGASVAPLKFVNLREAAGWSSESAASLPKMAALLAAAALPAPEPVATVNYQSAGNCLIIGSADVALPWARRLAAQLDVNVLLTSGGAAGERLSERVFPVWSGRAVTLTGYLGQFEVRWEQENPIDLEACTRCNACIDVCPENAIDFRYQIDADKCGAHRDCVKACGLVGAIDFSRVAIARDLRCDLVFDLSRTPLLRMSDTPQGYFAPGTDVLAQFDAALKMTQMVGEFEKPKFFSYKEKLCAHSRSAKSGCNACIEVCSTAAISSKGDKISVNPNLCAGCGACSTVCPTGALSYAYMRAPDTGLHLKTMLAAYHKAGGVAPALLFHSQAAGADLLRVTGQNTHVGGRGLPARVIPFALHHTAALGLDVWLTAVCYGATSIALLLTDEEAPEYRAALTQQMQLAQSLLEGFGYAGVHLHLLTPSSAVALEAALHALPTAQVPAVPALFNVAQDKRVSLDFVFDHLQKHAPQTLPSAIALPAGAPFGSVEIQQQACTLCMACVGACPSTALMDNSGTPQLRFIERNCVQCGLCVETCPEQALSLSPRLLLGPEAKQMRVLNEAAPYHCIRCSKPFATAMVIENMLKKLGTHSAFAGHLERLRMCSDCRVVDMMRSSEMNP